MHPYREPYKDEKEIYEEIDYHNVYGLHDRAVIFLLKEIKRLNRKIDKLDSPQRVWWTSVKETIIRKK